MLFYDVYGDMTGASRWMMRLNALLQVIQTVLWIHDPQLHNPECPTRSKLMHQAGFCCIIYFNGRDVVVGSNTNNTVRSANRTKRCQDDNVGTNVIYMKTTHFDHETLMHIDILPCRYVSPRVALIQMHCNLCGTSRSWNSLHICCYEVV